MTTLLAGTAAPGSGPRPAAQGARPDPASGADRRPDGFFDCRGEWHSLDEED